MVKFAIRTVLIHYYDTNEQEKNKMESHKKSTCENDIHGKIDRIFGWWSISNVTI